MPRIQTVIRSALFGLAVLALSPANLPAQSFGGSTYKAEAAIMSAGSRAAAISRLKAVPSVGVVNLNIRRVPRFGSDVPDIAEFRISAGKNFSGIKRLRMPSPPIPSPAAPWQSAAFPSAGLSAWIFLPTAPSGSTCCNAKDPRPVQEILRC